MSILNKYPKPWAYEPDCLTNNAYILDARRNPVLQLHMPNSEEIGAAGAIITVMNAQPDKDLAIEYFNNALGAALGALLKIQMMNDTGNTRELALNTFNEITELTEKLGKDKIAQEVANERG